MMAMIGDDHTIRIFKFMMVIRANIAKSILYAFARINHVIGSTSETVRSCPMSTAGCYDLDENYKFGRSARTI